MKNRYALLVVLVAVLSLVLLTMPLGAAPLADCSAFGTGGMNQFTTLSLPFACEMDSTVYFGVCDSGPALEDFFNITYQGAIVAYNEINGPNEAVYVGSSMVAAGSQEGLLNSLRGEALATYSYAISSDYDEVTNYLNSQCGSDFGGVSTSGACNTNIPIFTQDGAPSAGTLMLTAKLGEESVLEDEPVLYTWQIYEGQQLNNVMAASVTPDRYVRLWWQSDGDTEWYLLPSQYWHGTGLEDSEYGVTCMDETQPSYHTAFADAVPASDVCFDVLNGCN